MSDSEHNATKKTLFTHPQVRKLMESSGEDNLDQLQRRTYDYASKFSKTEAEIASELVEKLTKTYGLEDEEAVQIVNCMPKSVNELKTFLASGRRIIEVSTLESIVKLLEKQRKLK